MSNYILKGDICYSQSKTKIHTLSNGYVVCEAGKCKGIYQEIPAEYESFPIRDYSGMLIIPGMVDLHIHAPQYSFRGMGMDSELIQWLNTQTFPEEAKYQDDAYARKAYAMFAKSMKNSATSRACIFATRHGKATEILMDLMEETGLITYVGKVNMDRSAMEELLEESAEASARDTVEWLQSLQDKYQRTKPILTPRFIPSCSDDLMDKLQDIQCEYSLPVQSHLSENPGEIEWVKELRPDSEFYGDAYDKHDLFGGMNRHNDKVLTVMAHCVWSGESELQRMKDNEVFIAHCPASNLNLSSGIAPIRKYLDHDMKLGLGSDVAGGHTESMFRAMTDCIQVSKMYWRYVDETAKPVTFEEAFYLATKGGGEFFGKVGSFEEDYELDAVILDDSILSHPLELDARQRLERAVYLALDVRGGIKGKIVAGDFVLSEA